MTLAGISVKAVSIKHTVLLQAGNILTNTLLLGVFVARDTGLWTSREKWQHFHHRLSLSSQSACSASEVAPERSKVTNVKQRARV